MTAGSLPKPSWLARPKRYGRPGKLEDEELVAGKQDARRLAGADQRQAGIDILGDGKQTRQHLVTTFVERLEGVDFEQREPVRIRDRYDHHVPTVVGAVSRHKSVFGVDARFLRAQTISRSSGRCRADNDDRYSVRRASPEPREAGIGVRAHPQRGSARIGSGRVDIIHFDEPAFTFSSTRPMTGASLRWSARRRG
ncbi:hypothetical protein ACT009_13110 [Sphingomonas sp. Tas61C01]|uniref:hypothetical protein n=1 Tax=Sphingomonas sp. Tas61C01 TaxID=3458297 RepID=UPI00403E3881